MEVFFRVHLSADPKIFIRLTRTMRVCAQQDHQGVTGNSSLIDRRIISAHLTKKPVHCSTARCHRLFGPLSIMIFGRVNFRDIMGGVFVVRRKKIYHGSSYGAICQPSCLDSHL